MILSKTERVFYFLIVSQIERHFAAPSQFNDETSPKTHPLIVARRRSSNRHNDIPRLRLLFPFGRSEREAFVQTEKNMTLFC